ncbi:OmpA family protein [Niabella sp. CJ426]|uniref:OmpA family protein n=1 Tax=Niabella sp. CJ426 TaxID=3393740 RepID=UPI003D08F772
MKRTITAIIFLLFCAGSISAQIIDPKRAARRAAENRANQKVDQGIDKGLDKVEEGIGSIFKKKEKGSGNSSSGKKTSPSSQTEDNGDESGEASPENNSKGSGSFSSYSKFDFVPGSKIIAVEDFSQDALGDFPARWNTNGAGTLSKLNNLPNKFLMTNTETVFYPEFVSNLPENFTLEFDLASTPQFSFYSGFFVIGFTDANVGKNWRTFQKYGNKQQESKLTVEVALHPTGAGGQRGMSVLYSGGSGQENIKNEIEQRSFATAPGNTNVRVSIWRQKGRIRVYVDEAKIWDIPRAFTDGIGISSLYFRNDGPNSDADQYYISNIRVAVGAPDTRSKLITEGKYVTTGILFDVNSDKIKPASYGVLKDIAGVLTENEAVNVKIIGHTDSDGDEAANLSLSKKRAEAVKKALSTQFSISDSRMTTDGKGESQPAGPNTTAEGKANNRRVEFVKQ